MSHEPVQVRKVEQYKLKPAGFWVRFWAYLLDLAVIAAISGLTVNPLFRIFGWDLANTIWYAPVTIISSFIFYLYFVIMTKFWSQTVGKMVLGLKVISAKEGKLTWGTVLFREWIGRFFSATLPFIYWAVAFTPNKKGLHDFIADTIVVHENTYEKHDKVVRVERVEPTVTKSEVEEIQSNEKVTDASELSQLQEPDRL
ncbi:RDD family protein [Viridibacillus sp. YIM B01967]|uniref:RDD family protein n=1 Tax=Viridibacillus soli TaxID=2798301 RepID=A0ABS1H2G1_9BACL|nr:RDD family protein [Viridibacillus soli]